MICGTVIIDTFAHVFGIMNDLVSLGNTDMLKPQGPWEIRELIGHPESPIPEAHGAYVISILEHRYDPACHGHSRFIYIGGVKAGENSTLAKRVGEWFGAAFGFMPYHGPGQRLFRERQAHGLSPWDMELRWYLHDDSECLEKTLG